MRSSDSESGSASPGPALRYGTPLDAYDEDDVPSKRRLQERAREQTAVDAHGRRRFHGAFTGGFSAGHGNTVSTPEGWAPRAFKSSRADRGNIKAAAPEDFMDEEDRSEFGIAPQLVQMQSDFTSGQKRPHLSKRFHDGPIPGEPVLEQFLRAVPDTAAVRLLKGMGWRPGTGIGERRERQRDDRVYGCYVPPEFRQNARTEDSDSDTEVDYGVLFAPQDYEPYLLGRKSDVFGMGYSGLSRRSVLGSLSGEYGGGGEGTVSHLKMSDKGKKVSIRGQAFGVGALEEEDEDIYAGEDMSNYDFVMGGAGREAAKKETKTKTDALEGFVRASRQVPSARVFPPPALPRDYRPTHVGQTRFSAPETETVTGRHDLSANERGAFLGETPIVRPATTVQSDQLTTSQENSDLITKITGRNVSFVSTADTNDMKAIETSKAADLTPESENAKQSGFKPFASNPAKQDRYERFVKNKELGVDAAGASDVADRLTEWERSRELAEFEQAAKLYKPLTGIMNDRFTHGVQPDDALNPLTAVKRSSHIRGGATDQQVEAAKMNMYGRLTRMSLEWRPEPLVCKRFNIPDPYGTRSNPKDKDKAKSSYSIFDCLEGSVHTKESFTKEQGQFSGSKSLNLPKPLNNYTETKTTITNLYNVANNQNINTVTETILKTQPNKRMTVIDLFLLEAEKDKIEKEKKSTGEVTETIEKFDKMELYKSIFLSDSEEDDDDKAGERKDEDFLDKQVNVERNNSPPRGIFANLNFDTLNSWSKKTTDDGTDSAQSTINKHNSDLGDSEKNRYRSGLDTYNTNERNSEEDRSYNTSVVEKGMEQITLPKNRKHRDIDDLFLSPKVNDNDFYGPKIPENLKKNLTMTATKYENAKMLGNACVSTLAYRTSDIDDVLTGERAEMPKPVFRDKSERLKQEVVEVNSSSDESWVDAEKVKKKHKSNKKKKHKHKKHKKNKK